MSVGDIQIVAGPSLSEDQKWMLPMSHFGSGIITWNLPFIFRTPRGYGLLVTGPSNCARRGIAPLDGCVETDWLPNGFTMNWKLTEKDLPITFR